MQKHYNLATPELISKLQEVGAIAEWTRTGRNLLYRVRVKAQFVEVLNGLLTGSTFQRHGRDRTSYIYSKDVWNALRESNDRRTSYGHKTHKRALKNIDTINHCGLPINSFKFSDGSVIRKCLNGACTRFDVERQRVLMAPMKGAH